MSQNPHAHDKLFPFSARLIGGLLSFILPGMGHLYQGVVYRDRLRLSKGVVFFVVLVGMFYYGMWLGRWQNVYLPHWQEVALEQQQAREQPPNRHDPNNEASGAYEPVRFFGYTLKPLIADMWTSKWYMGQVWIGLPAWPALWNYYRPENPILTNYYPPAPGGVGLPKSRLESLVEFEQRSNAIHNEMGKMWDIAWVYTVLAGLLNILVIYDAAAGPFHARRDPNAPPETPAAGGVA